MTHGRGRVTRVPYRTDGLPHDTAVSRAPAYCFRIVTPRATVAWSYDLLSADERRLFDRLAVFARGWTLEAVEAVCGEDGLERGAILELLGRLVMVERSERGAVRYRLLETLRQFAQDRVPARGESEDAARP